MTRQENVQEHSDVNDAIWHVSVPQRDTAAGVSRVSAAVADETVWYASDTVELSPSLEAFMTAFFQAALESDASLEVPIPLDAGWLRNVAQLPEIFHDWWGLPPRMPLLGANPAPGDGKPDQSDGAIGQCFSGGVDSFHSLLKGDHDPDCLVFIDGFDIALKDTIRSAAFQASLQDITGQLGKRAITVRTNLREHSLFARSSWERGHGAALASVGLILSAELSELVIPSSYAYAHAAPWGSHWDTDPLWSLPGRITIVHDDASASRRQKVAAIAAEPLVQQHLRVCWQNKSASGNCSRCEKCVRTMVLLALTGELKHYGAVFDLNETLDKSIDRLRVIPKHLVPLWEDMATDDLDPHARQAIARLVRRSGRTWDSRLRRLTHRLTQRR